MVKNLPAMQETRVWSLTWEDPLEKGMANHSSILVWRVPWSEKPVRLQSVRSQRVGHDWVTNTQILPYKSWLAAAVNHSILCDCIQIYKGSDILLQKFRTGSKHHNQFPDIIIICISIYSYVCVSVHTKEVLNKYYIDFSRILLGF